MGSLAFKGEFAEASVSADANPLAADRLGRSAGPELSVVIHNLDEIRLAYGPGAAIAASDHVRDFLNSQLRDRDSFASADYVLRRLSELPVAYDGQRYHLFVSLAPTGEAGDRASKVKPTVYGNPAFPDDAWCRRYRADMALAVNLFEAMAEDRLALAWQPVRNADDPASILYHECLLRHEDANGATGEAGLTIEALERLGLVRALDRHVLAQAIAELQIEPFRSIGVNISALSLVRDAWWADVLARLADHPRVARRLFIELTETAQIRSLSDAVDLIGQLRSLGCKIVLDDFGVGHAAIRSILMFTPDVVKIDSFFMRNAVASPAGRETLRHMVGLAESLGAIVVVEGVESEADCLLANEAGAVWQQGHFHGCPSISRPWHVRARSQCERPPGWPSPAFDPEPHDPGESKAA